MKLDPEALEAAREAAHNRYLSGGCPSESGEASVSAYLTKMAEKATHLDLATGEGVRAEYVTNLRQRGRGGAISRDTKLRIEVMQPSEMWMDGVAVYTLTPITQADTPWCSMCNGTGERPVYGNMPNYTRSCPDCQTSA